ncbi:SDR family oxidoreductase [Microbacterium sp. NPDC091313]
MNAQSLQPVLVVIGVGGIGQAIARRLGSGRSVLLADFDEITLERAAAALRADGFDVSTIRVDVADADSVAALAATAARMGPVMQVAHTAGLSPVQAPADAIVAVDLRGVALVLDAFAEVVAPGGAGVVIASMAGHLADVPADQARAMALTETPALGDLDFLAPDSLTDAHTAYGLAKHGNHLRVRAASPVWGRRGARINSISPGIVSTPMGHQELAGSFGDTMRSMIARSAAGRIGTPDDIAAAAAFLLGPDASFITGTDLLVDGGTVAALGAAVD